MARAFTGSSLARNQKSLFGGVACTAAMLLCAHAGAATVETITFANVATNPVGFEEVRTRTVVSTSPVARVVLVTGLLSPIAPATYGEDAEINITAPDGQVLNIVPLPNVQEITLPFAASTQSVSFDMPVASAAGVWTFSFVDVIDDSDDQSANANWVVIQFNLESEPDPLPACPNGIGNTLTFTNVSANNPVGGGGNSIVTGTFGAQQDINGIRVSGRFESFLISFRSEVSIRATSPGGSLYDLDIGSQFADSAGVGTVNNELFELPTFEDGAGTWTFEFYESFGDFFVTPDATWETVCFAVDRVAADLDGSGVALPTSVPRDGVTEGILLVVVTPGTSPISTDISVTVDASSIGGSAAIELRDDGNPPDIIPGDNIFGAIYTVAPSASLGFNFLPYTITDAQGRFSPANNTIFLIVEEAENTCPTCPADYNQDGGVTGDDVAAFFTDFEQGVGCADTNVDGGITGDDVAAFFTAFEQGGC